MSEKQEVSPEQVESQQSLESRDKQARKDLRPTIVILNVCCCLCCLTFFLLFFLIPRNPVGYIESTTVYLSNVTNSVQVVQEYKVWNPSFYPVTLENFKNINLESDTLIVNGTYSYQFTAQGEVYNANDLHIPLRKTRHISLSYLANVTVLDFGLLTAQCFSSDGIGFYTNGNYDYATSLSPGYTYSAKLDLSTNYVCS